MKPLPGRGFQDPYLVGNGRWCSTCLPASGPDTGGTFIEATRWDYSIRRGCNECAGRGRIAFTAEEIVEATVAERRKPVRSSRRGKPSA